MSSQNIPLKDRADFQGSSRISGPRDYSRLSCSVTEMQLGLSAGTSVGAVGHLREAGNGRDFCRSKDDPSAVKPTTPLLSLGWTLRPHRACVWARTPTLSGSLLFPASAP